MAHLQTDGAQVFSRWHNDGMAGHRKRPRDPAQLTKLMIDIASGNAREDEQPRRDVTKRNALRFARVELARVTQMMALGEMAASIAHEINQPLAAIAANGNAGLRWLTRRTPDVAEARAAFQHIVDDSRRASEVISGIRSIFKKDGQGKAPHDINELIREVLALVRGEVENHQVSVQMDLCEELPQVATNQVQLRQVFVNLIMNAVDAMSNVVNRPRILRLRSEIHDLNCLLITVEDFGIGIDPKIIDQIFNPFFTTKTDGMGMGLSICRTIAEGHGGRLMVSRREPHGSIFHLLLPTWESDSIELAPASERRAATLFSYNGYK